MAKLNDFVGSFANDTAADNDLSSKGYPKEIGLFYENQTTNRLRFWDGTQWTELGGTGGGVTQWVEQNIYYVGKHGNDGNAGTAINLAFLTFGAAIAAASSGDVIVCLDAGTYVENLTLPAGIQIHAPNATLNSSGATSTLTVAEDTVATFREIIQSAGGNAAVERTNTTGVAQIHANEITLSNGSVGVDNAGVSTTAVLIVKVGTLSVASAGGIGVGGATNIGHIHVEAEDIYLDANNTIGINRGAAGDTIARLGHILERGSPSGCVAIDVSAGTVDIIADVVSAATLFNVSAVGTINGFISTPSGTQTLAAGADVRVVFGRAAPISGSGDPNGSVNGFFGQLYYDTAGGDWYICDSSPTGTSWSFQSSTDHQGPAIIVGNALEGDTLAVCDYLDTGNGAQLDAAVTAAGTVTPPADVWVRPGLYDFGLASGPAAGVTIPNGVMVRGASRDSTLISTRPNTSFRAFTLGDEAHLDDMTIFVPFPTGNGGGVAPNGIVDVGGAENRCHRVEIFFVDFDSYTATEIGYLTNSSIRAGFFVGTKDNDAKLFDCKVTGPSIWTGIGNPLSAPIIAGYRIGDAFWTDDTGIQPYFDTCVAVGCDMGFFSVGEIGLGGFECHACRAIEQVWRSYYNYAEESIYLDHCFARLADSASVRQGLAANVNSKCVDLSRSSGQENSVIGCLLTYAGISQSVLGIDLRADDSIITSNRIRGFTTAIDLSGSSFTDSCIVQQNRTFGGAIIPNTNNNDIAHNITTP